ncbi:HeH/LEM domain-containing protein [Enterococcus casseliflavus]|nr:MULTISPECIES: HeH/LEM domain-containing protein [Enterococcus]MEB6088037.1 HeH/LEM domain-containing protein [Enterococcus casseliflavus]
MVIDDMKVDELKAELDRLGVEYPAAAKKPELIELLKESE